MKDKFGKTGIVNSAFVSKKNHVGGPEIIWKDN